MIVQPFSSRPILITVDSLDGGTITGTISPGSLLTRSPGSRFLVGFRFRRMPSLLRLLTGFPLCHDLLPVPVVQRPVTRLARLRPLRPFAAAICHHPGSRFLAKPKQRQPCSVPPRLAALSSFDCVAYSQAKLAASVSNAYAR